MVMKNEVRQNNGTADLAYKKRTYLAFVQNDVESIRYVGRKDIITFIFSCAVNITERWNQ